MLKTCSRLVLGFILIERVVRYTWLAIYCFECDNKVNPSCGVYFKSYQFEVKACYGRYVKCGLQRQQPLKEDNFIGILRRCYTLGTIAGMNESDGCRSYRVPPENFTFEFCFCSEDYCNHSTHLTPQLFITMFISLVALTFLHSVFNHR